MRSKWVSKFGPEARLPIYLATEVSGKIQDVQLCLIFRQTMDNFFHY